MEKHFDPDLLATLGLSIQDGMIEEHPVIALDQRITEWQKGDLFLSWDRYPSVILAHEIDDTWILFLPLAGKCRQHIAKERAYRITRRDGKTYHDFVDQCYQQIKAENDWPIPTSSFREWMHNHFGVTISLQEAYRYLEAMLLLEACQLDHVRGYRDGRVLQRVASDLTVAQKRHVYDECTKRVQRAYPNCHSGDYQQGLDDGYTYQPPVIESLEVLLADDIWVLPGLASLQDHLDIEKEFSFYRGDDVPIQLWLNRGE